MTPAMASPHSAGPSYGKALQAEIAETVDAFINSLPSPEDLSAEQRRGILARYTAVLEGNFIYWMTAAYLAVKSDEARAIILDNLREEVRDCHPGMLRRFATSAHAVPTDSDADAVARDLASVRLFMGRLSAVPTVLTMAFFEGFIQRFMSFMAELADRQGSLEREYTDVHGVCDVAHTEGLFRALDCEMELDPSTSAGDLFEGVHLLQTLMQTVVFFEIAPGSIRAAAGLTH